MNFDLKKLLYTVITACCIFFAIYFFLNILPYLLIAGVAIYAVVKIKGFLYTKKNKNKTNNIENNKYNNQYSSDSNEFYSEDNDFSGEIIDVDYEESNDEK